MPLQRRISTVVVAIVAATALAALAIGGLSDDRSPRTLEEAQAEFDPSNDPLKLVSPGPGGKFEVSHYSLNPDAIPKGFPTPEEAGVETAEDQAAWVEALEAAAEGNPGTLKATGSAG